MSIRFRRAAELRINAKGPGKSSRPFFVRGKSCKELRLSEDPPRGGDYHLYVDESKAGRELYEPTKHLTRIKADKNRIRADNSKKGASPLW